MPLISYNMKVLTICIHLSFFIFPLTAKAQEVQKSVFIMKLPWRYYSNIILELTNDKFYTYHIPIDAAGHIWISTGTYEFRDTLLSLRIDTAAAYSRNTMRLSYMQISCDSAYVMVLDGDRQVVMIELEDDLFSSKSMVELELSDDQGVSNALKRFGGLSLARMKRYLWEPTNIEVKRCNE